MNLLSLSIAYIRARALTSTLLVVLLALGVATISLLLHVSHQAEERLTRDARGFDLVVGAKGSPLQLILSSIYHMDIPTGNISVSEANRLRKNRKVAEAIPLALGDTYRGFRIVGTETSYIKHYQAELAEGELFTAPMQAVIGARVARETALSAGGTFAGSHGLSGGGEEHADTPYMVVGRLKPTGTVLDRLILTPVESVWQVHGSHDHASRDELHIRTNIMAIMGIANIKAIMGIRSIMVITSMNRTKNMRMAMPMRGTQNTPKLPRLLKPLKLPKPPKPLKLEALVMKSRPC